MIIRNCEVKFLKSEQLTFDLEKKINDGRKNFFVSDSNKHVLKAIDNYHQRSDNKLIIVGPKSSGKTHLLKIWAKKMDSMVIDIRDLLNYDFSFLINQNFLAIDNLNHILEFSHMQRKSIEEILFHIFNSKLSLDKFERGLLITSNNDFSFDRIILKDLSSRLSATEIVNLYSPDEKLINALFIKLFDDRELRVKPSLINFLSINIERSFEKINNFVKEIDKISLQEKIELSRKLAKKILEKENTK